MEKENFSPEEIFYFLKMSIFQFLLGNGIPFFNEGREVNFGSLYNHKKKDIQNTISILSNNSIFFKSSILISEDILIFEKLTILANFFNEIFVGICCYVVRFQEGYSLFCMKSPINPEINANIDNDFWKNKLDICFKNVYIVYDFLHFDFKQSKYYFNKEIESQEFRSYLSDFVEDYVDNHSSLREIYFKELNKTKKKSKKKV